MYLENLYAHNLTVCIIYTYTDDDTDETDDEDDNDVYE